MALTRLNREQIGARFRDQVTTQEYGRKTFLEGVRIMELRHMIEDGGSFAEVVRFDENGRLLEIPDFQVRQSSYSLVLPGAIKAFHLHYNQEDVWFVPPTDRLVVGLLDVREGSPTYQQTMRLALGGGKAQILYIPRGVAHGCANLGTLPATVFYFVNQHFDLNAPDEHRLPWDILGADFWQIVQG